MGIGTGGLFNGPQRPASELSAYMKKVYTEELGKVLAQPSGLTIHPSKGVKIVEIGDYEKYMAPWIEEKAAMANEIKKAHDPLTIAKMKQALTILQHEQEKEGFTFLIDPAMAGPNMQGLIDWSKVLEKQIGKEFMKPIIEKAYKVLEVAENKGEFKSSLQWKEETFWGRIAK